MKKIYINDLLCLKKEEFEHIRVKFNQHNGTDNPMDLYINNPEIINNQWLFWRTKRRYFSVGQIAICLLKLSGDTWLLTTIKRVTKEFGVFDDINYEGEELDDYKKYFGRVIVKFHKTFQIQGIKYEAVYSDLEVLEILPSLFDGDEFPGYDKVCLTYAQLKSIIERQKIVGYLL